MWVRRSPGRLPPGTVLSVCKKYSTHTSRTCLSCPGLCTHTHLHVHPNHLYMYSVHYAQPPCPPIHITTIIHTSPSPYKGHTYYPPIHPSIPHSTCPSPAGTIDHTISSLPIQQIRSTAHNSIPPPPYVHIPSLLHANLESLSMYLRTLDLLCIHNLPKYVDIYIEYVHRLCTNAPVCLTHSFTHSLARSLAQPAQGCPRRRS